MRTWLYSIALISLLSCNTNAQSVSPEVFEQGLKGDVQLLDVRTPEEYSEGHIKNATLANVNEDKEFQAQVAKLDKNKPVYVYCHSGRRSAKAAGMLKKKGFKEVINLDGGVVAWGDAKKELEAGSGKSAK